MQDEFPHCDQIAAPWLKIGRLNNKIVVMPEDCGPLGLHPRCVRSDEMHIFRPRSAPRSSQRHRKTAPLSRNKAMTTQHHTSFTRNIVGSAQRLFRSKKPHGLLASSHIDARTMRDIGVNPVGFD
jgi:hypothetical protein